MQADSPYQRKDGSQRIGFVEDAQLLGFDSDAALQRDNEKTP